MSRARGARLTFIFGAADIPGWSPSVPKMPSDASRGPHLDLAGPNN